MTLVTTVNTNPTDDIYDIETYPNIFTFAALPVDDGTSVVFECSTRRNDIADLFDYLDLKRKKKKHLIGFNNQGFDWIVVDALLKVREKALECKHGVTIAKKAYQVAQKIINTEDKYALMPKSEYVKQIDLYKIHHFDNKARSTGLKMLMFNMRTDNIQDLPFPPGTVLTEEQMDVLIDYNLNNDVRGTRRFYLESLKQIEFRKQLTEKYGRNFLNHNDTKIGKDYFIMRLEEEMPDCCYEQKGSVRTVKQTKRKSIDIGSLLFNYYDFKRPEFNAVYDWLKHTVISETKGVFTDLEEESLRDVAKYATMSVQRKKVDADASPSHKLGWIDPVELKSGKTSYWDCWRIADNLNVVVDGFRFDFGTGGIHGSLDNTIIESDDVFVIMDADVASMYPNIAIANRVYPKHLSDKFCDIYKDVYEQRKSFGKNTAENAMLKLALNGVYGDSNNEYSPFYDPAYTMTITINGQLSLCLLAEKLMDVFGLSIIQVNTDGITVKLPRKRLDEYNAICEAWQRQVGLQLEFVEYTKMIIRDVNNYIAVDTNGKVKRKGAYQYENLGWHQDQGGLVIPKAAEAAMLSGISVEQFIVNHQDKMDFMLRTKVPRNSKLLLDGVQQQNICRYYISNNGGKLVKEMPPVKGKEENRFIGVNKEWNVKVCNNMLEFDGDINYNYYIEEARKLLITK